MPVLPENVAREGMGEIPKQTGTENGSNLEAGGLHGEEWGRDMQVRDAVRN